ncbi:HmuY family protein [Sphingobacterium sp. LRF_L2]|uniref:HmuY family protein n=1 Tax=Sphingobacterium sp. LRF_L2 TaxID=3369421 RepID=UPI003F5EB4DC
MTRTDTGLTLQKYLLMMLIFIFGIMASCSKDDPITETEEEIVEEEEETVDYGNFYKLIRVENFAATTEDNSTTAPPTIFYSLESNKDISSDYKKTRTWDLAFGGLYNSFLSANNGTHSSNNGYGTAAVGGILILEEAFDAVVDIPEDSQFKTGVDLFGTDINGDLGNGIGWYFYDFDGILVRDGAYDNAHVAYALADTLTLANGNKVKPRTLVIKTAKGNYAKLKMVSCYKDAFKQEEWFRNTPHMYFTFEYVMVPSGSSKFEVK